MTTKSKKKIKHIKGTIPYRFARMVCLLLFKGFFRLKVKGTDLSDIEGGLVVASNHQSYLDPPLVAAGVRRPIAFMARDTLFRNPLFGWLIRKLGAFPVQRNRADRTAITQAVNRLKDGHAVLLFPEGTRTRDGSIGKVKSGAALLAQRAQVPIVPVVVDGAFEAWPRNRRIFRFRRIAIVVGEPIPPPPEGDRESLEETGRKLQNSLEALLKQACAFRRGN